MALKNFSFRENWVGIEVAGMKIAFLLFLTKHGPTFWPPKYQNMGFLKQNFNFQSLRKTEVILLPSMWLKDWLTKVKISKIVTFCYFSPKMGKHFVLIFFRYGVSFLANLVFNFYSGIYIATTFLLVNVCLMQNMKKKPIEIPVSLFFFTTLDLLWPKFCPKDNTKDIEIC